MSQSQKTPGEQLLDTLLYNVPVLTNIQAADTQDASRLRFCQDLAYNIITPEDVAVRYGLGNIAGLQRYLMEHPELVSKIKVLQTTHNSAMSVVERNRLKAGHAVEELIPTVAQIVGDPKSTRGERMEAFKALQRQAGVDGMPTQDKSANAGASFNLTMIVGGKEHKLTATVVDPLTIEAPVASADEEKVDEDV
jgi:hypothetical protein